MSRIINESKELLPKYLLDLNGTLNLNKAINWYDSAKAKPDYCREVWLEVLLLEYFWLSSEHIMTSHPLDKITKTTTQVKSRDVGLVRASGVLGVHPPQRRFGYFVRADTEGTEVWSGIHSTETALVEYPQAVAKFINEVNIASLGASYAWFLSSEEQAMPSTMASSDFHPISEINGQASDIAFVMELARKYGGVD